MFFSIIVEYRVKEILFFKYYSKKIMWNERKFGHVTI